MKHLIILFLVLLPFGTLSAQQSDEATKRALEREIKVSGNYLYGEAVGSTKEEAVTMAKSALLSEINKEAVNHPEWSFAQTIQANGVEYNTDMIDLMRGSKFRVIAYIKKDNIQVVFDNKTPEIKIENKKDTQEKTQTPINQAQKTQAEILQATPAPASVEETEQPKVEEPTASVPEETLYVPVIDNHTNTSDLLEQIKATKSMPEIQKILDKNKRMGKVVSGTIDKLTTPEKAYLIVYNKTGEIVAILDKGNSDSRKDLLSGEIKGKEIQTQNQIIWFMLF